MIGEAAENCRLTDWPVPEMTAHKHLVAEQGCELYHRASYGHGCELDRWPFRGGQQWTPPPASYPPAKYPHIPSYGTAPANSLHFGDSLSGGKVSTSSQWSGGSGPQLFLPPSAYGDTSTLSLKPLDDCKY